MTSSAMFRSVNTKIRSMESKFLKDEDFENLLHKKNIPEVTQYLKRETHYGNILQDVNESEIHRRRLEVLIRKDHAEEIGKLSHHFFDGYKKFFRYVFIKREIEELKEILRGIENGRNEGLNKDSFAHIGRFSKVNVDALLSSASVGDFIKNLKGTIYYRYLQSLEDTRDERSLFMGEMILDLAYFDTFYRLMGEIGRRDREIVDRVQGTNVDLLNIGWIYRGLMHYNLQPEVLFNYTIPHGYEFSLKDIKELCYVKDHDEFESRIIKSRYGFLFNNEKTKDIFMERRSLRYQFFQIKNLRRKHEMNISEAIAFDVLLEYEIRDIVTVIECIRYGIPEDEAKKFLIREL